MAVVRVFLAVTPQPDLRDRTAGHPDYFDRPVPVPAIALNDQVMSRRVRNQFHPLRSLQEHPEWGYIASNQLPFSQHNQIFFLRDVQVNDGG